MKIFISQKMRNKTHKEIEIERERIKNEFLVSPIHCKVYGCAFYSQDFIQSYKPELAFKDPITSLSQSLAMLAEADIVLVPKVVKQAIDDFMKENVEPNYASGFRETVFVVPSISEKLLSVELLKGCEFEFLIAKSYGKKVYTYDDNYTFGEV